MREVFRLYGKELCEGSTDAVLVENKIADSLESIKDFLRPISSQLTIPREVIRKSLHTETGNALDKGTLFDACEIICWMYGWPREHFTEAKSLAAMFLLICIHDAHRLRRCRWGSVEDKVLKTLTSRLSRKASFDFEQCLHLVKDF
jgi:hypothetical protein